MIKNIRTFLFCFIMPLLMLGQNLAIGDADFEKELVCLGLDSNGLSGDILESDALKVKSLIINNASIKSFEGIGHFKNLMRLEIRAVKEAEQLDITALSNLLVLHLEDSSFTTLMGYHPKLEVLFIDSCEAIKAINTEGVPLLRSIIVNNTPIGMLDLSNNKTLKKIWITKNADLRFLNLANGENESLQNRLGPDVNLCENPMLAAVLVDAPEEAQKGRHPYIHTEWKKDRITTYRKAGEEILAVND